MSAVKTRLRAALHELRCPECRVTWPSWLQRLAWLPGGMTPRAPKEGPVSRRRRRALLTLVWTAALGLPLIPLAWPPFGRVLTDLQPAMLITTVWLTRKSWRAR